MTHPLLQNILIGGNHLASALLNIADPTNIMDYDDALHTHGQPYADIWVAWKAIGDARETLRAAEETIEAMAKALEGMIWIFDKVVSKQQSANSGHREDAVNALDLANPYKRREMITLDDIKLQGAIHALIGYTESLTPGNVVTQEYCDRLKGYYIPEVLEKLK